MKVWKLSIQKEQPTSFGLVSSSSRTVYESVAEEYYESEASAMKRIEAIREAQNVIGISGVYATVTMFEVKP